MDGILLINKNIGISSFGVCSRVRKKLNVKKVGHSGTLDPNAKGIMTILIGEGTKLSKYLVEHDKEYIATLKLGIKTDTLDEEGKVIKEDTKFSMDKDENYYEEVLNSFKGKIEQIPPMYSAIKIGGKKLYEYAREGKEVERKAREVEIYSISICGINNAEKEITFIVNCSKGTYIRTLCEQIAEKLGTVGYMKSLTRTRVDDYMIEDSITLEELEKMDLSDIESKLITIEKVFEKNIKIEMTEKGAKLFKNGVMLTYELDDGIYRIYKKNEFIGIGIIEKNLLKRDIVL